MAHGYDIERDASLRLFKQSRNFLAMAPGENLFVGDDDDFSGAVEIVQLVDRSLNSGQEIAGSVSHRDGSDGITDRIEVWRGRRKGLLHAI
jgi:hypothetical protein